MNPITYLIENNSKVPINRLNAKSSTFGMVAPLEKSQTNIVQLYVPDVLSITNIRLALIDSGGIVFDSSVFGVDSRKFIDNNLTPESFFTGISDKSTTSPYNISVNNLNKKSSDFIYINLNVPIGQVFISGTIRYQWLFDYA
jgi:hypothetical protein